MAVSRVSQAQVSAAKYGQKVISMPQIDDYAVLLKEYRRLAKTADQRLVRLEKYQEQAGLENITAYAYKRAIRDIQSYGGPDAYRFNTKPPQDIRTLKAKMNDMLVFLNSPTSTKKGVIKVYQSRADALNRKYGTSFNWQDLAEYFDSGMADQLALKYGSKTALMLIGRAQKDFSKIKDKIHEVTGNHVRTASNQDKLQAIGEYLLQSNFTIKDLI